MPPHLARLKSLEIPADVLLVGTIIRPMLVGMGAMLLVGGWSVTQFAAEQQHNIESSAKMGLWLTGHGPGEMTHIPSGRTTSLLGMVGMAVGGGVMGFGWAAKAASRGVRPVRREGAGPWSGPA